MRLSLRLVSFEDNCYNVNVVENVRSFLFHAQEGQDVNVMGNVRSILLLEGENTQGPRTEIRVLTHVVGFVRTGSLRTHVRLKTVFAV